MLDSKEILTSGHCLNKNENKCCLEVMPRSEEKIFIKILSTAKINL